MNKFAFVLCLSVLLSACSKEERIFDEKGQARPTEHASNGEKKCHRNMTNTYNSEDRKARSAKMCKADTSQKICEFYFPKELCAG